MTRFKTSELARQSLAHEAAEEAGEEEPVSLTGAAQDSLRQIADALGVTIALLSPNVVPLRVQPGPTAGLHEASALLQAYLRIEDPAARQRCLSFVQAAAP